METTEPPTCNTQPPEDILMHQLCSTQQLNSTTLWMFDYLWRIFVPKKNYFFCHPSFNCVVSWAKLMHDNVFPGVGYCKRAVPWFSLIKDLKLSHSTTPVDVRFENRYPFWLNGCFVSEGWPRRFPRQSNLFRMSCFSLEFPWKQGSMIERPSPGFMIMWTEFKRVRN